MYTYIYIYIYIYKIYSINKNCLSNKGNLLVETITFSLL